MPRPFTLRTPTIRELSTLHQQLNQLAIAAPEYVHAVAILVNYSFAKHLKAGKVVPTTLTKGGR